jgi:hypothetical protein
MIKCPICKSYRILHLRHDQDWDGGNDCDLINSYGFYLKDDLRYEENSGDINIYQCLDCNFIWDIYQEPEDIWKNIENNRKEQDE